MMISRWRVIKDNYIDKKIKIIPIKPNSKIPAIDKWNEYCSYDYMQVLYWYESDEEMNFAIPCYENNLFVIDLDKHDDEKDGIKNFDRLLKRLGINEINTLTQNTPSGGKHIIFKSDKDLGQVRGIANAFSEYPGIDLRNRNYILVEPSIINGVPYKFSNNANISEMPPSLKDFILTNVSLKTDKKKEPYEKPKHVDVGDRDNQLFDYINSLYFKTRLDYEEILLLANHFNETVFEKPLSEKSVIYKVKKAFDKDRSSCIFVKIHEE